MKKLRHPTTKAVVEVLDETIDGYQVRIIKDPQYHQEGKVSLLPREIIHRWEVQE